MKPTHLVEKGTAAYQLFLLVLSIYVLAILFAEEFLITDPETRRLLQYVDLVVCMIFLMDFFVNLFTAPNKLKYLKWGWIDFLASIPMIDPLRWGRLSRVVRILRFLRTIKSMKVLIQSIQRSKFQSFTLIVFLVSFIAYTLGASLILEFESEYGGEINTANEALWWAFLNVMNAKIAITQAQSPYGMAVTVVLNKVGLLLFAYFNAMIIAWLVQKRVDLKQSKSSTPAN